MHSWKQKSGRARFLIITLGLLVLTGGLCMMADSADTDPPAEKSAGEDIMSAMGHLAQSQADAREAAAALGSHVAPLPGDPAMAAARGGGPPGGRAEPSSPGARTA